MPYQIPPCHTGDISPPSLSEMRVAITPFCGSLQHRYLCGSVCRPIDNPPLHHHHRHHQRYRTRETCQRRCVTSLLRLWRRSSVRQLARFVHARAEIYQGARTETGTETPAQFSGTVAPHTVPKNAPAYSSARQILTQSAVCIFRRYLCECIYM